MYLCIARFPRLQFLTGRGLARADSGQVYPPALKILLYSCQEDAEGTGYPGASLL